MSDLTAGGHKVLGVRLQYMLEPAGRRYSNSPGIAIRLEGVLETWGWLHRQDKERRLFYAINDGLVAHHHHSGDDRNEGGYGGRAFRIQMEDGSTKVLAGPWFGSSGVSEVVGEPTMEVTIFDQHYKPFTDKPDDWGTGTFGCNITLSKIREIIHLARPVDGEGSGLFRAIPVVIDGNISFAIMKDGSLWRRKSEPGVDHTLGLVLEEWSGCRAAAQTP